MNFLIIISILGALLFAAVFFTRRRFGVLGLALVAGATLSGLWSEKLTPVVEKAGLLLDAPPLESVVAAVIIVLPALALLFTGSNYTKLWQKVVGSAVFAVLALAFLLGPLGDALVLQGDGKTVYDVLVRNKQLIVTGGILYALFDLLSAKAPKLGKEKHGH